MSRNTRTSRSHLFFLILLTCLALIAQFAIPSSYSSNQDKSKKSKTSTRKTTTSKPRPKGEAPRISGGRAAAETSDDQNPVDESLVVTTYDLPMASAASFDGDVRELTPVATNMDQRSIDFEERLQELETPIGPPDTSSAQIATLAPLVTAPAPAPLTNFPGLFRTEPVTGGNAGAGTPPDTNGDVGPNHFIISVNDAYGIYDKTTGSRLAAFTENSLFSSGTRAGGLSGTGTLCDTNSFGDPVVVYDQLADRWILTNFAFVLNSSTGLWVPPIFQCFAASKTSNPVSGGWWVYAVRIDTGGTGLPPVGTLDDYPKFGNWNDGCLYMGANAFNSAGNSSGAIFASLNKNDMYNGLPLHAAMGISNGIGTSLFPSNLLGRAPNQLPPAGTPNYFVTNSSTTSFQVRRFTPGAQCGGGGSLSAATTVAHANGPTPATNLVPQPNDTPTATTHTLDSLGSRIMQKVQYRKIGSAESLWVIHTVRPAGQPAAPQWAQINVSGGTVATPPVQQQIYQPDTILHRWMGSVAVDTTGNMAIGYSTGNGTAPNFPSIAYSGRLVTDPSNTLPQTETQLIAGGGSQIFNCGGAPCHRWGDYSSMSLDPTDDCTFWYTSEYYDTQANGNTGNWHTRIGSFKFPSCVPITPVITCPANITVNNDAGVCGAVVNFTGAQAATATGNPTPTITYSPASGSVFPIGTTTVTATATNSFGSASCTFTVTVNDNELPVVSNPTASSPSLWPPNHKMVNETINYTATDNCPNLQCVLSVTSNEPLNNTGDGDTSPDWVVIDSTHVSLRAERAGTGVGRIYTITVTCTDASGNVTSKTTTVTVPHDGTAILLVPAGIRIIEPLDFSKPVSELLFKETGLVSIRQWINRPSEVKKS